MNEIPEMVLKVKPVSQEEWDKREAEQLRQEKAERVRELKQGWGAPKRHMACKARREGEWGKTLDAVTKRLGTGFTVALIGGYGPGKTQLAVEVMRHQVEQRTAAALYCTAVEFFMSIKETYRKDSDASEKDVLVSFSKPGLLVIDEIGKRSDSAWENLLLFELLDRRYRDMRDTVVIANQTLAEFTAGMGSALCSRMSESGGLVECTWPSFRE